MGLFFGEFQHNLDSKGRIAVPARFRDELGETVMLVKSIDNCLSLFTKEGYEKYYNEQLATLNQKQADVRGYIRKLTSRTFEAAFDSQGRILVPSKLAEAASLIKECVFIGVGDHLELWDNQIWNDYYNSYSDEDLEQISEGL